MFVELSIPVPDLRILMLTSLSVHEILLPRYINMSTYFRSLPFNVEMSSS